MPTPEKIIRFYQSSKWKKARAYIRAQRMGICEECGDVGHEVHHKIPLSLNNIDDDSISVNESNLQLLCTSCHNAKRGENLIRSDVEFDSNGDLVQRKQYIETIKHKL